MKPSTRRQLLIDTAYRLFNKNGFHPTGIDLIIRESGISKATLYKYFKSKEVLILEVLKNHHDSVLSNIQTTIENNRDEDQPVLAIFDIYTHWFKQTYFFGCLFNKAGTEFSDINSPINQFCSQSKQELTELVRQHLHQNHNSTNAQENARSVVMLLDGAIIDAQIFKNTDAAIKAKQIASQLLKET